MPLHIVITGSTGFIGSAVLAKLVEAGACVTVLLRPNSNLARLEKLKGFERLVYSRLLDAKTIGELKEKKPDIFIHCGWHGVGGAERSEAFQITENISMTLDSVELAVAGGCRQWIGLGSQAEYGNQNCRMNEDAPLRPTTLYGKAKLAAGVAALGLCEAHKIAGVWLRVFSIYGPGDAPDWLIPYVIGEFRLGRAPKLTQCEQWWDYLYIADAANAIVAVADGETAGVFNLGSGQAESLKQIIEIIRAEVGGLIIPHYGAVPYRPDQVMHLQADISRLVKEIGWSPRVGLREGLKATINHHLVYGNHDLGY